MELNEIQRKKYGNIEDNVGLIRSEQVFLTYSAKEFAEGFNAISIKDGDDVSLEVASRKLANSVAGILSIYEYRGDKSGDVIASQLDDVGGSDSEAKSPDQMFLASSIALMRVFGAFYDDTEGDVLDTLVKTFITSVKVLMDNTKLMSLEESMKEVEKEW
jgi:hypothetical protein